MASLLYPRSLLTAIFSHRFHRSAQNLLTVISSHEFTEFTEPSYCDFLPQISQICTEPSRCDFLPQISQICTEPSRCDFLPQISQICAEPSRCDFLLQNSQNLLAAIFSHRFHRSAQKLLVEKGLPQIARIYTDVGGYGIPAVPTQPTICVDQCNPWENCIPTERRIHRIPNTHHL